MTLTITDDDTRGVTVTGGTLTMDEADNAGTQDTREDRDSYTMVLDSEPTDNVRIDITAPAIVTLSPTSLTFTPSNWNVAQTVTATAVDDTIDNAGNERAGNITHRVVEGDSDYASVTAASVAVTVNDDDGTPTVALELTPTTIDESGDDNSTTVTASLSGASSQAVTLTVAAAAVSPAATGDFTVTANKNLTIAAGATESTGTVTITAVDNDVDAANKTVTVSATASGGGVADPSPVTLTITDDDGEPTLSIDAPSVAEGNSGTATMTFKVTLSTASGKPVSVAYADATTGTATSATDYAAISSGTLNFAAGQTEKTVDVTVNGDTTDEPSETVILRLSSPSNARLSGGAQTLDGTGTITDDDDAPTVSVADATAVNEGDDPDTTVDMSFTVTLSAASANAVTVPYTLSGTATGGSDYETPSSTSLSIPAGDSSGTIVIKVKGDALDEPNETIIVTLGTPTNATVSTTAGAGTGTGTITDDDGTPAVTLKLSSASITENGGSSTVTASLSGASHQAVTLTVAAAAVSPAAAGDFTLSGTTLTIAAGATESTGTVTVTAVDNDVDAANKTLTVSATATGGGVSAPSAVTLTITDDDTRGISVAPVTLTLAEVDNPSTQNTSEHQETYSIELDSQPTGTVTVNLASGDTTIATLSDNSLEFTTSDWDAQTVTVTAAADDIDNTGDARTVRITHTVSATGTDYEDETAAAVDVTVTDDDGEPALSIDSPSVAEGDSSTATMTFKVTLSPASGKPVSVAYADATTGTATSATDYAAITGGTLNFAAGQTEKTVDVTVNGDTTDEPNETVILRLSSPSNAVLSGGAQTLDGTGTINDDDGTPSVTLELSSASITENGGSSTVTASLSGASHQAVTLTVAAAAVSPAATGDFTVTANKTLTIAAGATESTGTVTVTAVDNDVDAANKTVTVSATATGGGVSDPSATTFTITDDDTRGVTVTGGSLTMDEADNAGTQGTREDQDSYTVVLDSEPTDDVRIDLAAPAMVTLSPTSLTFTSSNWNQAQTVTATAVNDTIDNAGDARTGSIAHTVVAGSSDYADVAAESVAVTVNDDDGTPSVTLKLSSASITENGGASTVTASLSGASSQAITLTVAAAAVSPAATGDYTLSTNRTLTIAAGATESTGAVTITAVDNDVDAADKTVTVSATATGGGVSAPSAVTLTITDDDDTPTVSVADAAAVNEGNDPDTTVNMSFTVSLSAASANAVTVPYTLTGTATGGSDYETPSSTSLSIPAGDTSGTIVIKVKGDILDEPNETIVVTLGAPTNATVSTVEGAGTGTGTINDDDDAPSVTLELSSASITENGGSSTVTASLSSASHQAVTLTVAAAAVSPAATGDFTVTANKTLTIAAGATESTGTVTITAVDNDVDAANKTVTVSATATGGGVSAPSAVTLTITDDDTRGVTVAGGPLTMDEADNAGTQNTREDQASYTVVLDSEPTDDVSINITAPAMVTLSPTSLTFTSSDWNQAQTVTATAVNDSIDNAGDARTGSIDHTVVAGSSDYTGVAAADVAVTVNDDDSEPTLSIDSPSVTEGDSGTATMTFKVTLTPASGNAVSVAYADATTGTATSATDYAAITSGTLNFTAGQTEKTVVVTVNGDTADEPNETVVLRLSSPSNARLSGGSTTLDGTGTITDDDGTPAVTLELSPASITENGGSSTVTATLSSASHQAVTLTVAAAAVSPAIANDFTLSGTTLTIAAGATSSTGTATITAVDNDVDAPNKTVTVSATASGGGVANPADATLTITDDDDAPTGITLSVSPATLGEGDGLTTINVTATVNGSTRYTDAKTVTVSVGGGTAVSGTDYGAVSNFDITIAATEASQSGTFDLTPTDDALEEQDETIEVTGSSGALTITPATVTIEDNDATGPAGTVSLSASRYEVLEGDSLSVTVKLSESPADDTVIELEATSPGGYSATPGTDYDGTVQTVTIRAGATSGRAHIWTTRDNLNDPNETFELAIRASELPGTVTLGTPHTAVVTIREPVSGITPPATATVEYAGRNSRIRMPVPAGLQGHGIDVAFYFETRGGTARGGADCREDGTDLVDRGVFIDFNPGTARNGPVLRIVEDINANTIELDVELCEGSVGKTFFAAWDTVSYLGDPDRGYPGVQSYPFNAAAAHCSSTALCLTQVTITGDTPVPDPEVTIAAGSDVTEGGDAVFTVQASPAPTSDLEVALAIADDDVSDFLADGDEGSKTVTIAAGSETATYTLATTDDDLEEADGSVSATLEAGTGYRVGSPSTATVAVEDDDATSATAASLSVSPSEIMEADGDMTITVTATLDGNVRTEATELTISVDPGTAQADDFAEVEDFPLTIPANAASAQADFVLSPFDDQTNEPAETVIVSGTSTISGFTVTPATVTIRNEDPAASDLSLLVSPGSVREDGGVQTVTVTARFDAGTRADATDVNVAVAGGTAIEWDDFQPVPGFTITVPANQASASWDFPFTPVQDALMEGSETVTVSATTSISGLQTHDATLTIEDSTVQSGLVISIDDAEGVEGDFIRFRVHLSESPLGVVRAKWFTHPDPIQVSETSTDYYHDSGEVVFQPGEQEKFIEVWLIEDGEDDPWETFQVWLYEPQGAVLSDPVTERPHPTNPYQGVGMCCEAEIASGRIFQTIPDPVPVEVSLAAARTSVAEGGSVRVTATLAGPLRSGWSPRIPLVYTNGTAEPGDHAGPANVTIFFSSGQLHGWADIDTAHDADADDETFTVSFGELPWQVRAGASSSVQLTIIDNDGPQRDFDGLTVSIADATAYEGREDLEFAVTLNGPAPGPVSVSAFLESGTAERDVDFRGYYADVDFAAGERLKWMTVIVEDDLIDEGVETMTVELDTVRPDEIAIARRVATGRIVNSDPMPRAWLARFGRTVADQSIEAVMQRMDQASGREGGESGNHLTIAGRRVGQPHGDANQMHGDAALLHGAGRQMHGAATPFHRTGTPFHGTRTPFHGTGAPHHGTGTSLHGTATGPYGQPGQAGGPHSDSQLDRSAFDLLMGTSFHYSPVQDDEEDAEPDWQGGLSFWGVTSSTQFSGTDNGMSLQGNVGTATLGVDARGDRLLGGVALSYSSGRGDYTQADVAGGAVRSTLFGVHPYAHWQWTEQTSVWGILGYGLGDLSLSSEIAGEPLRTDLDNAMAAFGGRTVLFTDPGSSGHFELALRSDVRLTNTASEAIDGLVSAAAATGRARLLLEGSANLTFDSGAAISPTLEAGLRYDQGDAETGKGIEVGAGLGYHIARLKIRLDGRGLLAHDDAAYEEWGWSASVGYSPDPAGRGFGLELAGGQGNAAGMGSGLWQGGHSQRPIAATPFKQELRSSIELSYGFVSRNETTRWTPKVSVDFGESGQRLRLGGGYSLSERAEASINLTRSVSSGALAGIAGHGYAAELELRLSF